MCACYQVLPLNSQFTFSPCCALKDWTLHAVLLVNVMLNFANRGHWGAIAGRRSLLSAAFAFSCSCCALCQQSTGVGTSGRALPQSCSQRRQSLGSLTAPARVWWPPGCDPPNRNTAVLWASCQQKCHNSLSAPPTPSLVSSALPFLMALLTWSLCTPGLVLTVMPQLSLYTCPEKYETSDWKDLPRAKQDEWRLLTPRHERCIYLSIH